MGERKGVTVTGVDLVIIKSEPNMVSRELTRKLKVRNGGKLGKRCNFGLTITI